MGNGNAVIVILRRISKVIEVVEYFQVEVPVSQSQVHNIMNIQHDH